MLALGKTSRVAKALTQRAIPSGDCRGLLYHPVVSGDGDRSSKAPGPFQSRSPDFLLQEEGRCLSQ